MVSKSKKKRLFDGKGYREIQRSNTQRKELLSKTDQSWLREHQYKNVGWDKVIQLQQKINDFLNSYRKDDLSLEDLFLEADRIGSKYQTAEEINAFYQALSETVESIGQKVDQYFPDEEPEVLDYSPHRSNKVSKSTHRNS